jgi:hypothetical protein
VERTDNFIGYFRLNLLAEESDQACPLNAICLAIEVCSSVDVSVLPEFSLQKPSDELPKPWGWVNPSEFALKHAWFLEKPTAYTDEKLDGWRKGQPELQRWVDQPLERQPKPLLSVATRESTSRTECKFATLQMRMQAVHTSDTRHYRPEVDIEGEEGEKVNQRQVRVRTNVMQIDEIDLKKVHLARRPNPCAAPPHEPHSPVVTPVPLPQHAFSADVFLEAKWRDYSVDAQRFVDQQTGLELADDDRKRSRAKELLCEMLGDREPWRRSSGIFDPGIFIRNKADEKNSERWYKVFDDGPDGRSQKSRDRHVIVACNMRMRARFIERFELDRFPLDTQTLELVISCEKRATKQNSAVAPNVDATGKTSHEAKITVDKIILNSNPLYKSTVSNSGWAFPLSSEYELSRHVHGISGATDPNDSSSNIIYPMLLMQMRVRRRIDYYIQNLCLPIFMITTFAAGVFTCDANSSVTDRLQTTFVTVLTIVGARARRRPRAPCLTRVHLTTCVRPSGRAYTVHHRLQDHRQREGAERLSDCARAVHRPVVRCVDGGRRAELRARVRHRHGLDRRRVAPTVAKALAGHLLVLLVGRERLDGEDRQPRGGVGGRVGE